MKQTHLIALAAALLLLAWLTPPAEAAPRCFGLKVTIKGTPENDRIVGTEQRDVIAAGSGNDRVLARGGDDVVCGGDGDDRLDAGGVGGRRKGSGCDVELLSGGRGDDIILGDAGLNFLMGGPGRDRIHSGGNLGRCASERLRGGLGDDHLYSGTGGGRIVVEGGPGNDHLVGAELDADEYSDPYGYCFDYGWCDYSAPEEPRFSGVADYSSAPSGVNVNLTQGAATGAGIGSDTLVDIASIVGSKHADRLQGGQGHDELHGSGGSDVIRGEAGDDFLSGDGGDDDIDGGAGLDAALFTYARALEVDLRSGNASGEGSDTLTEVEDVLAFTGHASTLTGSDAPNQLLADANSRIVGGEGNDLISTTSERGGGADLDGGAGVDYIVAGRGDDRIAGGDGDDELLAGPGIDALDGGNGYDVCRDGEEVLACEA
ncbi:MAG TPA: calcium-binding protein [Actinomycetota bacterium]|nr:calcium-binding protein [Actinomycetota bacterium]